MPLWLLPLCAWHLTNVATLKTSSSTPIAEPSSPAPLTANCSPTWPNRFDESKRQLLRQRFYRDRFFSSLKYELVYHHRFATLAQARTAIFDYIETFYNRTRLHSSLDYQSPTNFESQLNRNYPYQLSEKSGQAQTDPISPIVGNT